jgi:hypothetical protein
MAEGGEGLGPGRLAAAKFPDQAAHEETVSVI